MYGKKILAIIIAAMLTLNIFLPIIVNASNEIEENNIEENEIQTNEIENNIKEGNKQENEIGNEIQNNETVENIEDNTVDNEIEVTENLVEEEIVEEIDEIEENMPAVYSVRPSLGIQYVAHVQDIGWQAAVENGEQAGTTGRNLKIEAMKISLTNNSSNINIKYASYLAGGIGWQKEVANGQEIGTTGQNRRLEAIKIWLENTNEYSVKYRTHVQDIGWQEWKYDGEISGNLGDSKKIEAIEIQIIDKVEAKMSVSYTSHVQDIGWQGEKQEYDISGTTGRNLKIEAIKLKLNNAPAGVQVKYRTYVQNIGWQGWAKENQVAGTTGLNLKVFGIRMELEGTTEYSIYYRGHVQDIGWTSWKKNGDILGNIATSRKIEAIQVKIVKEKNNKSNSLGIEYYTYLKGQADNENKIETQGQISGTTGQNRKMEGLQIELLNAPANAHIRYKTHIENIGWVDWSQDGGISGIMNSNLKIEAIKIELVGLPGYTVQYKAHVQDKGWTDWYIDGETAGTTGQNKKIEAIQIQIVAKYRRYFKGIDVSYWQGEIDFDKLASGGQIDFMIARIGWYSESKSTFNKDTQFERNYKEAKRKGIPLGAYFYSYAMSVEEAKKEAQQVVNYLRTSGQTSFELPIFYDIENSNQIGLGKETITQMCIAFCNILKNAGFDVGVYSYSYWLENYMYLSKLPSDYNVWVANYGKDNDGTLPDNVYKYADSYHIWQYTDSGSVNGINGNVDMSVCYKKYF